MKYLNKEDVDSNNITISTNVMHLEKYDMYYINIGLKNGKVKQVKVFCEKGTFPDIESNAFRACQKQYGKELSTVFVESLLGPDGLMAKAGRDDYIYLGGDFMENGRIINRWVIHENGKLGKENFEDDFFKIKMQVEAREEKQKNNESYNEGKHYAIADIHGMYGSYMDVIKRLSTKDNLYIIGDVIDRGSNGIKILQDIIRRIKDPENNPKITFLMGNHEMQFIETISMMINHGLNKQDLLDIIKRKNIKDNIGKCELDNDYEKKTKYEKELNTYNEIRKKLITEKGISGAEIKYIELWLTSNNGEATMLNYMACSPDEKEEIYKFMYNSYVVVPQKIDDKDYLFVHAMPPKDENMIKEMKKSREGYKLSNLSRLQYEFMLQTRDNEENTYELAKNHGFTTICGHEPTLECVTNDKKKGYIRIDAGCGHNFKQSKLALYCIEDNNVRYIDEKEEDENLQL